MLNCLFSVCYTDLRGRGIATVEQHAAAAAVVARHAAARAVPARGVPGAGVALHVRRAARATRARRLTLLPAQRRRRHGLAARRGRGRADGPGAWRVRVAGWRRGCGCGRGRRILVLATALRVAALAAVLTGPATPRSYSAATTAGLITL